MLALEWTHIENITDMFLIQNILVKTLHICIYDEQ